MAGERLDRIVAMVTGVSRAEVADLVADGAVRVDGVVASSRSVRLAEGRRGDRRRPIAPSRPAGARARRRAFPVVHEDDDVIVVDKPAGLVVHPGAGHARARWCTACWPGTRRWPGSGDPDRPGIVHRLDQGTSGLLVVARTPVAYDALVAPLAARTVDRRYRALVWGDLDARAASSTRPSVGRREPTRRWPSTSGAEARTRYEVLSRVHRAGGG